MVGVGFNLADSRAVGALGVAQLLQNVASERLSTGLRINRGKDDPAGIISASELEAQLKAIEGEVRAMERRDMYLSAQDGAQASAGELVGDLESLAIQAANTGAMSDEEIEALQSQADSIIASLDRFASTAEFNGERTLDESGARGFGETTISVDDGSGGTELVDVSLADLKSGGRLNLVDGDLEAAQQVARAAVAQVASSSGRIGAEQQQVTAELRAIGARFEQTSAVVSLIRDADFAAEASALARGGLLGMSATQMAGIARENRADQVFALLGGV